MAARSISGAPRSADPDLHFVAGSPKTAWLIRADGVTRDRSAMQQSRAGAFDTQREQASGINAALTISSWQTASGIPNVSPCTPIANRTCRCFIG